MNGAQLDKALRSATTWDATRLQEEFTVEREAAAKKAELMKEQLRRQKMAHRERMAAAREHHIRTSELCLCIRWISIVSKLLSDLGFQIDAKNGIF